MSRRTLVKGALAAAAGAGATGGTPKSDAADSAAPDEAITPGDIAVADKIAGRSYTGPARKLMTRRLQRDRDSLRALRGFDPPVGTPPAIHFDPRLPGMPLPPGKSAVALSRGKTPPFDGDPETLAFLSAADLSRLSKARRITSVALTRMYLDRLKRFGPRLNCVVTLTEERALAQAERADREIAQGRYRGPLHGIPWGAKDLLATKGVRTTWGARPYESQVFDFDATVVQRLEAAGAILVAKL